MHIISGLYKGLSLSYPTNQKFRPTQNRVREALMSILRPFLQEAVVLDLCCGTGGLGLEALSQGAAKVIFVDQDIQYAKENTQKIISKYPDVKDSITLIKASLSVFFERHKTPADIILLDPPWQMTGLYHLALKHIEQFDILSPNGVLVCEHHKSTPITATTRLDILSVHTYGDTALTILKRNETP